MFLVRKGNPKGIKDWDDLAKEGVAVITPNPKTSGGAQLELPRGLGLCRSRSTAATTRRRSSSTKLYKNVAVLDSGARGSHDHVRRARHRRRASSPGRTRPHLAIKELGPDKFEIVVPSLSILAEPPVAVVDKNVDKKGTRKVAEAYLEYLYSPEGQEIAGKNFYRPTDEKVAAKYADQFPKIKLFTIDEAFGGWKKAHETHFKDGAIFDQIYVPGASERRADRTIETTTTGKNLDQLRTHAAG